jgi:aspartyl-tRNA(Asn)/glutamyl-tRNA(Gln) amidotransferase subunit B
VGSPGLGVKTEVKNLNSFRFLEKALEYEIERQIRVVSEGGRVIQETRLWDTDARETVSMRSKEEAHDYRYFPEPDLPPVVVSRERIEALRATLPELPDARRQRLMAVYHVSERDVAALEGNNLIPYFEQTARALGQPKAAFNWVSGELARKMNELGTAFDPARIPAEALAALIRLVERGAISNSAAKEAFQKMYESGRRAEEIVRDEGLAQIDDRDALAVAITAVVQSNPDAVEQYRRGKTGTFGFLVGQVMKSTSGKANPRLVNELLRAELDA